ncbi:MAG: hypothetical protein QM489_00450 [Candidatus Izemoplasma sp.]
MGSGKILKRAQKKYGIENFTKKILKVFTNLEDMFKMEALLVSEEFVSDKETYNLKTGGEGGWDAINSLKLNVYGRNGQNGKSNFVHGLERKKVLQKNGTWDAYLLNLSKSMKENYSKGLVNGFKNKFHSKTTKALISSKAKERLKDPMKNSQYGTMWIFNTDTLESKKVLKSFNIPKGWEKGRRIKKK